MMLVYVVQLKLKEIHATLPQHHPWVALLPLKLQELINADLSFWHLFLDIYLMYDPRYIDWCLRQRWRRENTPLPLDDKLPPEEPLNEALVTAQIIYKVRHIFLVYPDMTYRARESRL
jgi:hypothetical protein